MGWLHSLSLLSVLFTCSIISAEYSRYGIKQQWVSYTYRNNNQRQYMCGESNLQYDCIFSDVSIDRDTTDVRFGHEDVLHNYQKNITFKNSTIKKLPETLLDSFMQLELLNLTSLQIEEFEPFAISNGEIRVLFMSFNVIRALPIFAFRNMRFLNVLVLDWNELSSLPEGIFFGTPSLSELSIANNNLERIDDNTFKKSKALEFLSLSSNKLTHIDLSHITSLIHGNVSSNLLTTLSIPAKVVELDASLNRINTVTGPNNEELQLLLLQHNNLTDTAWLLRYSGLVDVDLSYNELKRMTYHHFKNMYRLERLYLNNNRLVTLNLDPPSIRTLKILDVRHNHLRYLGKCQKQFDALSQLYLDHNTIVTLNISSTNALNRLTLSHNDWDCNHLDKLLSNVTKSLIGDSDQHCKQGYQLKQKFCCKVNEFDRLQQYILQPIAVEKLRRAEGRCSGTDIINSIQNLKNYVTQLGGASLLQPNPQLQEEINRLQGDIEWLSHNQSQLEQSFQHLQTEVDNYLRRYRVTKDESMGLIENLSKVIAHLKSRNALEQLVTNNRLSDTDRKKQATEALAQEELALHAQLIGRNVKEVEIQMEAEFKNRKIKWLEYVCKQRNLCEQSKAN